MTADLPSYAYSQLLKESQLDGWKLQLQENGVTIHRYLYFQGFTELNRRMYDNMKRFYCWREEVTIKAPPSFVLNIITDITHRHHYDTRFVSIRIIEKMGSSIILSKGCH